MAHRPFVFVAAQFQHVYVVGNFQRLPDFLVNQQNADALKSLRTAINSLNSARAVLLHEIKRRFPKYADFIAPQPATFSDIQQHLRPGEALIALFPATDRTYAWAIPYKGEVHFAIEPTGKENLQKIVVHLRKAVDSDPSIFGDIPAFDLSQAHSLYRQLLQPVEKGWKDANGVIVVAHGPLGQLPFSVLPTNPVKPSPEKYELFARYRKVPWLIRKVSINRQPSVSSFITLAVIATIGTRLPVSRDRMRSAASIPPITGI